MKPLIPRSLFLHFSPSPYTPLRRPLLLLIHTAAAPDDPHPHLRLTEPNPSSSYLQRRHHDDESRAVKVAIWWDFENCNIPVGVNVCRVSHRITSALRSTGIRGPVTINAFGDVAQLSRSTQEALISTGVCLTHVPHSGKNSSDRSFMVDLVYWVCQNPPPAHFFLISGDKDFANILHRLRMSNYNILLASTDTASSVLCSAATIMWPWSGLAKGEDVIAKHFNHPPDGVYGSWYGHYRGALDDPFANAEQTAAPQSEESIDLISEVKPRAVPRAVVNGIRQVLHSYPEGISLSELRTELKRNNITMDKDFFGHKKFSQFLSSLPSILKVIPSPAGGGQPLVVCSHKRTVELVESSSKPPKEIDVSDENKRRTSAQHEKQSPAPPSPLPPPTDLAEHPRDKDADVHTSSNISISLQDNGTPSQPTTKEAFLPGKETDIDTVLGDSTHQKGNNAEIEEGIFKRIKKFLFGPEDVCSVEKTDIISEVESTKQEVFPKETPTVKSLKNTEKVISEESTARSRSRSHPPGYGLRSSDVNKSAYEDKADGESKKNNNASQQRMGFFRQIRSWWISGKSGGEGQGNSSASIKDATDNLATDAKGVCAKVLTNPSCEIETYGIYSKPYFWHALKLFLQSDKGSELISTSRTREQLVHGLQTKSALVKNLKESHLRYLVDLLISEKKWVEESGSQTFPFKLSLPANGSNGLSSLFTGKASQSNLQRPLEQERQDDNARSPRNIYNGDLELRPPQNLVELKAWLQKVCNGRDKIEPVDFQKLFERKFNRKLVCSFYGHSNIQSLLVTCLSDAGNYQEKKKRPPNREEILSDCHKLLTELFEENPEGFNMSIFRPRFIQKYGYLLDFEMLGYPKLVSLLQIMPGVRIESSFILPATKFLMGSNQENPPTENLSTHGLEKKGNIISSDEEVTGNGDESAWAELGPVSDMTNRDNRCSSQKDKATSFTEVSFSEEEFSDFEDDAPSHFDGPTRKCRRREEDSSLLQILDSWYNVKEGGEKDGLQAVDGFVDCSRSNSQKSPEPKSATLQKLKARSQKPYSFVLDSGDEEKDKLVESILGSLKKSGDSRLQS